MTRLQPLLHAIRCRFGLCRLPHDELSNDAVHASRNVRTELRLRAHKRIRDAEQLAEDQSRLRAAILSHARTDDSLLGDMIGRRKGDEHGD